MFPFMVSKTGWYPKEVESLAEECFYSFNICVHNLILQKFQQHNSIIWKFLQ